MWPSKRIVIFKIIILLFVISLIIAIPKLCQIQISIFFDRFNNYNTDTLDFSTKNDFTERNQLLWNTCNKRKLVGKYRPNAWEFFISRKYRITWCNVFKAGSSLWINLFNILGGFDLDNLSLFDENPIDIARLIFPRPSPSEVTEALSNSISFLIVRDPFERILSAFRSKLEHNIKLMYEPLAKQIVQTIKNSNNKTDRLNPTFREFLQYLVHLYRNGENFDEHWAPINTFCTPCSVNFTLIVKMETFQRDTEYIVKKLGLTRILLQELYQNKIQFTFKRSNNTKSLVPLYFSQIDKKLLRDVLKIYELDFELFGYNSTKYFEYVQQSWISKFKKRKPYSSTL